MFPTGARVIGDNAVMLSEVGRPFAIANHIFRLWE